ncbi:MAG: LysM peptidoglycan-binding domain-containing protein [Candidatus Saccharimonadaceae bacterium]|nr:LysM peptidoglycan-binding domain-containing protein [Candidatus Saccharimonadaceae bacterium]
MSTLNASTAANAQTVPTRNRRKSAFKIKPFSIAVYVGVFMLVIALVSIGYHEPKESSVVANAAKVDTVAQMEKTPVDDVIATGVAADVAQVANLPIATSVSNLAVSAQSKSEYIQPDSISATKPQIIESTISNRSVIIYTVKDGDTMDSIASRYGITKQTIKWANNMTTETVKAGETLKVLPVDGVLYTVKNGDTTESIADKYGADKTRIIVYNDLEVSGLQTNTEIILPNANLPVEERPGYVAPVQVVINYSGTGTGFGGDTWYIASGTGPCPPYAFGNCTCYAYNRRLQFGLPVGGANGVPNWGNASSWAYNARLAGLAVDSTPSVGAIIQNGGGLGHVAIVEAILENGDLSISEMNAYVPGGGWNIVSGRIVPAGNIGQYLYIH